MAPVTLTNISKQYPNGHEAISDLSLEIADGEFLVVVGPSDAGSPQPYEVHDPDSLASVATGTGSKVVGRFSPRSRVSAGNEVLATVNASRLHFFDLADGGAIW